jgi:hypothetical protein
MCPVEWQKEESLNENVFGDRPQTHTLKFTFLHEYTFIPTLGIFFINNNEIKKIVCKNLFDKKVLYVYICGGSWFMMRHCIDLQFYSLNRL